jgi:hypothetical protein
MQSSRAQEIRAAGGVAAVGLAQTATRIGQIHHAVAARSFAAVGPAGLPARLAHEPSAPASTRP